MASRRPKCNVPLRNYNEDSSSDNDESKGKSVVETVCSSDPSIILILMETEDSYVLGLQRYRDLKCE